MKPTAASARTHEARFAAEAADGGPVSEFFAALGDAWRLTAAQRARLAPAALTALSTGWKPAALAEFTCSNTDGVRNPYAVLAARLCPRCKPAATTGRASLIRPSGLLLDHPIRVIASRQSPRVTVNP